MNPARSIGPAIIMNEHKGLWICIAGPLLGTIAGAFTDNLIRFTEKPLQELTKSSTFMKSASRARTKRGRVYVDLNLGPLILKVSTLASRGLPVVISFLGILFCDLIK